MAFIDWFIIAAYFLLSILLGLYFAKRAGRDTHEFFLSGRNLPWWLAGLSMVATTFAADTPLAVTELVASRGVAGNWLWWNMCIGGMLTVFFFARLWRRAGIMTDMELIEIRYSGRPAAFLRGFRAIYLGIFMNCIIIGWVNVAMGSILKGMFGLSDTSVMMYLAIAMLFTAIYSALSGLWGVAVTDAYQFVLAMAGCIVLAVIVVNSAPVGGLAGLRAKLPAESFNFFPVIASGSGAATGVLALSGGAFFAYIGIQWWSSWYPGAEPGGGGYVAQRIMSAKNEKHSLFATLFFQIAHYCIRPWPWILVGLSTLILYPALPAADKKLGYIYAMNDFLPAGLKGLLLAAFFAAYMSTLATHLNWGTSYIIHDFWRRFIRRDGTEKHYVFLSRIVTLLVMGASLGVTAMISTISGAWQFLLECGAGLGLVLIARWYWWRVNAWSEIAATLAPIAGFAAISIYNAHCAPGSAIAFPATLYILVPFTTLCWLAATFLTAPTEEAVLIGFYERIRPGGRFWKRIADKVPHVRGESRFGRLFFNWIAGVICTYAFLFGLGSLLFGSLLSVLLWFAAAAAAALLLVYNLSARRIREADA